MKVPPEWIYRSGIGSRRFFELSRYTIYGVPSTALSACGYPPRPADLCQVLPSDPLR